MSTPSAPNPMMVKSSLVARTAEHLGPSTQRCYYVLGTCRTRYRRKESHNGFSTSPSGCEDLSVKMYTRVYTCRPPEAWIMRGVSSHIL
eukprot:scaffold1518_cov417-Prasinococcus_capsulatus_cf.AAC.17